jgi:hypothetical protein
MFCATYFYDIDKVYANIIYTMPAPARPTIVFISIAFLIIALFLSQSIFTPYYRVFCPDTGICTPRDVELAVAEKVVFVLLGAAVINVLCVSGFEIVAWGIVGIAIALLIRSININAVI